MIGRFFSLVTLLVVLLSYGCGAQKTAVVQPPADPQNDIQTASLTQDIMSADVVLQVYSPNAENRYRVVEVASKPEPVAKDAIAPSETQPEYNSEAMEGTVVPEEPEQIETADAVKVDVAEIEESVVQESEEPRTTGQELLDSALDLVNSAQESWNKENQDKAIAILDEAFGQVIKVDTEADPELFQQKEDLRYMISKRILEIYASRYSTASGNHNEIPLTLNEYVEKEIKRFQGPEHKFFVESYRRSGRYIPMIQAALKEAGLPEDLAWIPMIESGFKADALSRARALGLWQFIASTGQKFGLKRGTYVDERMDPQKSTMAAIAYMKELHQIFGDWTTVLAGYNCGEGRVLQKIRSQKINYLDNFWDLFQMLPYETARYVPRYLATLHILRDPAKYGFELGEPDNPVAFETVTINKAVQLKAVAQAIAATEKELADLNPELRHKSTPASTYVLKVPEGKGRLLLASIDKLPKYTPPSSAYASHTVRNGETLSDIAVRYHTSVSKIALANNIRKQDFIRIGQKLKVPLSGTSVPSTAPVSTAKLSSDGKYRVQRGDSLWMIARRFNTNAQRLQQVNGLKNTVLQIGQVLVIPQ